MSWVEHITYIFNKVSKSVAIKGKMDKKGMFLKVIQCIHFIIVYCFSNKTKLLFDSVLHTY